MTTGNYRRYATAWIGLLAIVAGGCASANIPKDAEKPGWKLTFHDEFDGTTLSPVWAPVYHGDPAMPASYVVKDGMLHLQMQKDFPPPRPDKKGRVSGIESRGARKYFAQQYGRFEIRARAAKGVGLCSNVALSPFDPAFMKTKSDGGTRASADEATQIDIFEHLGKDGVSNNFNAFFGAGAKDEGREVHHLGFPTDLTEGFHVYVLEWTADSLVWYVDGKEVHQSDKSPHAPFIIHMELLEGDNVWRGPVDTKGPFPKDFEIDYVRVYRKAS